MSDLEAVLRLERECFEAPHWTRTDYCVVLEGVEGGAVRRRTYVWESGTRIVGFSVAMVLVAGGMSEAQIENLAVASDARHQGIGRALCDAALDWCAGQGVSSVGLEVRASNAAAIALYTQLGFVHAGARKKYYSNPIEDALVMDRPTHKPVIV